MHAHDNKHVYVNKNKTFAMLKGSRDDNAKHRNKMQHMQAKAVMME